MILDGTWAPPGVDDADNDGDDDGDDDDNDNDDDDDDDDDEQKKSTKTKFVSNDRSGHDDQFCPQIVKIGDILVG